MRRSEQDAVALALDILRRAIGTKTETVQFDAVRLSLHVLRPYAQTANLIDFWKAAGWKQTGNRRKRLGEVYRKISFDVGNRRASRN